MVSLWPWKGEDNSPASFEKTLSALAVKITDSQQQLDQLRTRGRRFKALWTLYTSFVYLLAFLILFLVVGWKNWTPMEYTMIAGSPVVIYLVRSALTAYYNYRVESVTSRLEEHQAERTKTIEKLKAATKYNSTQELLEKYGAAPPKKPSSKPKKENTLSKSPRNVQRQPSRTSMGPPATANIPQMNSPPGQPSTPQPIQRSPPLFMPQASPSTPQVRPESPGFAPNAFSAPPQYAYGGETAVEGHWYDRVLDLLMGEDETLPKNRMVLICQHCKLVNGQAPPGTKRPQDLGKWRCFGCGGWNGEEDEGLQAVKEIKKRIETEEENEPVPAPSPEKTAEEELGEDSEELVVVEDEEGESPEEPPKSKKGRPKGSRKKA
ncbi:hypothetical protein BP5796_09725 [Coleophoma crateriformis]|uniref:Endoplasmic reticulum junction formation protein lunapark n=1 Tax=Coleophoma crateriformis TaxID=565419 RepID=A0A3D8QYU8_9HELO|nr:hypothetical protein BP5796_09725 [Coleophoma crateriformis]